LWDRLLLQWLSWMRRNMPAVAVRAEVGSSAELMLALINGLLDFAVIYSPQQRGHIAVEPLLTEQLVLVESPGAAALENRGFIFVDWGPEFLSAYTQRFPDMPPPPITVGLGLLGLHYILENGGSGYFPLRLVQPELAAGRLARAADAPVFTRPAYLAYPRGRDEPWFDNVLQGLRAVAGATAGQDAG
ncbi:MAG TPA: LysR substrate-binding domain-containing protein, partial [Alphaproteobacteria bacterium]|nr:LysR substrate-binding domain-containing protein [Alphaproteobacteria bacterium]